MSKHLYPLKILDFLLVESCDFAYRSVYYVGATDCPIFCDRKSAEIVLAPETEQGQFRRTQEGCSVVMP